MTSTLAKSRGPKKVFTNPNHSTVKWDPRVLDSFAEHALCWNPKLKGFSLRCTPQQELAVYLNEEGLTKPVEDLNVVCHLVLAELSDLIPCNVQQALIDPASDRRFASLTALTNVGDLVPQEVPKLLASSYIFNALFTNIPIPPRSRP